MPRTATCIPLLGILVLLLTFSCKHKPEAADLPSYEGLDTCPPGVISFTEDVLPIFQSNCAKSGCHDAATHTEGLILDSYLNIMATGEIQAGDPTEGDIMEVIQDTDPDKVMPPPPNAPLTSAQINIITQWIQQGAQNTTCSHNPGCDTVGISFTSDLFPIIQSRCLGCHNGSYNTDVLLTNYSDVVTYATNGRLMGAIRHSTGYSPMPKGGSKLSDCNIRKFELWIDAGMPNN